MSALESSLKLCKYESFSPLICIQPCKHLFVRSLPHSHPSSWLWPLQVAATACSRQSTHALSTPTESNELSSRNSIHQHAGGKTSIMGLCLGHSQRSQWSANIRCSVRIWLQRLSGKFDHGKQVRFSKMMSSPIGLSPLLQCVPNGYAFRNHLELERDETGRRRTSLLQRKKRGPQRIFLLMHLQTIQSKAYEAHTF